MVRLSSLTVTSEAKTPCGQFKRAASIWPVWLQSSSIACFPSTTIFGLSFSTRALKSLATCRGTVSWSVTTWIARSAPIASAVRSCSCAAVGPTDTATISVATFFSFSLTASSIAANIPQGARTHTHVSASHAQKKKYSLRPLAWRTDLVKGVHRHLHVARLDARLVRLHADLHGIVDDTLRERDRHRTRAVERERAADPPAVSPARHGAHLDADHDREVAMERAAHAVASAAERAGCQHGDHGVPLGSSDCGIPVVA